MLIFFWVVSALALLAGFGGFAWAQISATAYEEVDDRESLYEGWDDDWGL